MSVAHLIDPIERAKKDLVDAAMSQEIDPTKAGISGYLNSVIQTARTSAICEALLELPVTQARMDELIVKHLDATASQIRKITLSQPRIQLAGHG